MSESGKNCRKCVPFTRMSIFLSELENWMLSKDTLEDVSLGQLGRLYIKTVSLSKLLLTEARRSLEGQNALPRTEQSFVFHIVEWKVLDSYNSACSAPYLQTKGK